MTDPVNDTTTYAALIERLEKVTGPDRQLDGDIALAVGYTRREHEHLVGYRFWQYSAPGRGEVPLPHYTAHIDDALKTLEPGWEFTISTIYGFADVELPLNDTRIAPVQVRNLACNVPAAICIAALKARGATGATR